MDATTTTGCATAGIAAAIPVLLSGGCGEAPAPAALTVEDSAGVRIVTHLPGAVEAAHEWSLPAEPASEIGAGGNAPVPLHRVKAVRPLGDGRVAVGTDIPPRVLVFREDGSVAATLGREGEGPGEFSRIGSVVRLAADSLGVWDPDRRRISVFTDDGRYVRDFGLDDLVPLSLLAAPSSRVPAAFTSILPLASGSLVAFVNAAWGPGTPEAGAHRLEMNSHRIDLAGEEMANYGPFPGRELHAAPGVGVVPYPFGAETHAATSGDALVVGTAGSPELRFHAPDGALEQIVRWSDHDRTVAGSPLRSGFDDWLGGQLASREPKERELLRELLDAIPVPERFPAYAGIIGDADSGEIWVGEYPGQLGLPGLTPEVRPMPARRWLVFRPDGGLVATVPTPERFEPHAVRDGGVWGVHRDELDVESVRSYRIVKR